MSVFDFKWYRNGEPIQDPDPLLSFAANGSLLTITAASQAQSGNYSCKGLSEINAVTTPSSDSLELQVYGKFHHPPSSIFL